MTGLEWHYLCGFNDARRGYGANADVTWRSRPSREAYLRGRQDLEDLRAGMRAIRIRSEVTP
jgi:hypothetical protein